MMNKPKKLVILSSGGDAPGMNAAIRAAVRTAIHHGIEVYGAENGYSGLIHQNIRPINSDFVGNIVQRGGTVLKTGRCPEFKDPTVRAASATYLQQLGIDYLVVLGGDGSFRGAGLLAQEGGPATIGIPCTIDNDITGTEYCIGFDTARNTALEAIDKIRDTAYSLDNSFMIEVMGRATGFIAVDVGISGGAEAILIPEFPITTEALIEKLQKKRRKKGTSIMVVAEADCPGRSVALAEEIKRLSGIEYKVCILGHTQRGGSPTVIDRKIGSIMGAKAIEGLLNGESCKMVAEVAGELMLVPFPDPKTGTRFFKDKKLLEMNDIICE
jgi:6-phosphofructokinase 1